METLNKAMIVDKLLENLALSKPNAKLLVDSFFQVIRQHLECGHDIKLSGFGNFILRDKTQRPGRNPRTGEKIPVSARRVVVFRAGLKLKRKIAQRD